MTIELNTKTVTHDTVILHGTIKSCNTNNVMCHTTELDT